MTRFSTSNYIEGGTVGTNNSIALSEYLTFSGTATSNGGISSFEIKAQSGIMPQLYFKYIKKKFGMLEAHRLDSRLKKLEIAFNKAVENGQSALGEKLLLEVARETRESTLYAKGIRYFIEKDDLDKHKKNIRGGHISDTKFKEYTRVIPEDVLTKKKKVEEFFDGFVIYHYWNADNEQKMAKKEKMAPEEKQKMRDPVLFGVIKESNRMYFVADWNDDFCDLSFDELVDVIGKDDSAFELTREPKILA